MWKGRLFASRPDAGAAGGKSWLRGPRGGKPDLAGCAMFTEAAAGHRRSRWRSPAAVLGQGFAFWIAILLMLTAGAAPAQDDARAFRAARTGGNYMHNYYLPAASSTPWRPAWSPDGKEIAFAMSGSIWKIRVGDTTAYELTANRTYDSSPVWSPDGRWIAYTAEDDGKTIHLMLLNVRTGESTVLTRGDSVNVDPAWSPDGKQLAYVSTAPNGWFNIYVMPVNNGAPGAPVQITADHRFGRPRLYFSDYDSHIEPTWSPDGKEIIAISNRGIPLGSGGIWRMPVKPDAMAGARLILREETLYRTRPQWSPDGKRILYSSHRGSQFTNLYVLPVEGGEPYQLTFGAWDHFEPRWSPDGEWIVYVSNQNGLSELRLLKTFGGEERKIEIRRKVYRRPMGTVEITVKDASSGQLAAARVYARAADGKTYAPPDAYQRVGERLGEHFFHTAGRSVMQVPPGRLAIEAVKGFEYRPASQSIEVRPGEYRHVDLALSRMTNWKSQGWYSGSNHVHMNYGGNLLNTPENMMLMASAEDIDVIEDKICNKDNRIFDYQYFTGSVDRRSTPQRLLFFNEEYRPPFYGHVSFVNLAKHLISPFTTGYEGTAIESLYPSNTDIFQIAKAQGALTGYVHPWTRDPEKAGYAASRGFPVDLALGVTDYLEVLTGAAYQKNTTAVWHRALNCGFRLSGTGGEDSILSLHRTPIMGSDRTYAYLGPKLDYSAWVDAFREGRTFFTNGPLLDFHVNGRMPGDEISLPAEGAVLQFSGKVESIVPLEKLEIINNGNVIQSMPLDGKGSAAEINTAVRVSHSGWYTLRAHGGQPQRPIDDLFPYAETSPIYVICGGRPIRSAEDAQYFIRWIDDITRQAGQHSGWRSDKERQHVLAQFAEARRIFEQRRKEAAE
ncbi:MAG TPA: CehA/McbA family metallohydrolase [Bryobacterales bacterium]|nr:CehA/McbA family metallohydrolase [Bryobacterales bacterium]